MSPAGTSASPGGRPRASRAGEGTLPAWPARTVAVLSTAGQDVHAIPVPAPARAGDRAILLWLHRSRGTPGRIRRWPEAALTVPAEGGGAFTARGRAAIAGEPMAADPEYSAVPIAAGHADDHRQPASRVPAGADRERAGQAARAALAARVRALSNAPVQQPETPARKTP